MGGVCSPAVRRMGNRAGPPRAARPIVRPVTRSNPGMRTLLLGLAASVLVSAAASDAKRDLQGIWEAHSTAEAGLEAHGADAGIRAGASVIVDPANGKIPYKPEALAKRAENYKNRATADPV